jgi:hypothetical protein
MAVTRCCGATFLPGSRSSPAGNGSSDSSCCGLGPGLGAPSPPEELGEGLCVGESRLGNGRKATLQADPRRPHVEAARARSHPQRRAFELLTYGQIDGAPRRIRRRGRGVGADDGNEREAGRRAEAGAEEEAAAAGRETE